VGVVSKIFLVSIVLLLSCSSVAEPPEIIYEITHPNYEEFIASNKNKDYELEDSLYGEYPKCDYDKLASSLVFPEYARQNFIEGRVIINVLLDTLGRVLKVSIDSTANDYLNGSALKTIFNTEFEPAKDKNGNKITVSFFIPVRFKLRSPKK